MFQHCSKIDFLTMSSRKTNKQVLYFQLTVAQGWFSSQKEGVGAKQAKKGQTKARVTRASRESDPGFLWLAVTSQASHAHHGAAGFWNEYRTSGLTYYGPDHTNP